MHLPAKMAIWRKASDPGDPAGDVCVCVGWWWGDSVEQGVGGGGRGLHLTEFSRISDVPHTDTSSQSRPNYGFFLRNKSFLGRGAGIGGG